jgi:hypothetical protein
MPITPYLGDFDVDPETLRVLSAALEKTRLSLGLADHFADGIIARRVVAFAKAGKRRTKGIARAFVRPRKSVCSDGAKIAMRVGCRTHDYSLHASIRHRRSGGDDPCCEDLSRDKTERRAPAGVVAHVWRGQARV